MNKLSHQPTLKSAAAIAGRGLLAAALVMGGANVASAQPAPQRAQISPAEIAIARGHFERGNAAMVSGNYALALAEFEAMTTIMPDNFEVNYNIQALRYYVMGGPVDYAHPINDVNGPRASLSLERLEGESRYRTEVTSYAVSRDNLTSQKTQLLLSIQRATRDEIAMRQRYLPGLLEYFSNIVAVVQRELQAQGVSVTGDPVSHESLVACESLPSHESHGQASPRTMCRRGLARLHLVQQRLATLQDVHAAIIQRIAVLDAAEHQQPHVDQVPVRVVVTPPDHRVTVPTTPETTQPNIATHWLPLGVGGAAGVVAITVAAIWGANSSQISAEATRCAAPGQPSSPCSRQEINDVLARNEPSVLPGVAIALGVVGVAGVVTFFATPARVPVSTSTTVPTTPRPRVNRAFILPSEGGAMVGVGGTF